MSGGPTFGIGVIGAGIMGERVLRALAEHAADVARVTGVWDQDPQALARAGGTASRSVDEVIEGADCVYIATPPATHLGYARAAVAAGKAVFLEKPLAVDVVDARAFVEEAQTGGHFARVAVNYPFASSPAVERLQAWLHEGAASTPRNFEIAVAFAEWPRAWQRGAAGWLNTREQGGFTREVVSHFLFLARRLLGPLHLHTSRAEYPTDGGPERRVEARLDAGGLPGTVRGAVGETAAEDHNTWTVRGLGAVRLRDWSLAERERPDGSWATDPDARDQERMRPLVLRRQFEDVARMTRGESHRLATLNEALEVQNIVEAILAGRPAPEVTRST